jgi:hypothetical protein
MYLAQGPHDANNVKVALVLIVIMVAAFWRTIIRLVLAVLVAVVLVAVGYGMIAFVAAMHA